jgi:hypothetical protein
MIFPGMDPYLEDPHLWRGVHQAFVVYARDFLQPLLRPRYVAAIEERVYLQGPDSDRYPDVLVHRHKKRPKAKAVAATLEADEPVVVRVPAAEVHEAYVAILDLRADERLVAVIEVVSPTNKYAGPGRESYLDKQKEILHSKAHLVEIDLLRTGPHVLAVAEWAARAEGPYDYLACVNRAAGERDEFDLYPRTLRDRLPRVRVPLGGDDPDVPLDVQAVLERTYELGAYADRLAYDKPCQPPLAPEDQAWANRLIKESSNRSSPGNGRRKRPRKERP